MNRVILLAKLEKYYPAHIALHVLDSITATTNLDEIVDVRLVDGEIKCLTTVISPRDYLKGAILHYFNSKCPEELTTYTQLDKLAKSAKKDFDNLVIEAITDMINVLEE